MFHALRLILVAIVSLTFMYFVAKGIFASIKNRQGLLPTIEGMRLKAMYLTIATFLGVLAIEIYIPNLIWLILLPISLLIIWIEYLIYLMTWRK